MICEQSLQGLGQASYPAEALNYYMRYFSEWLGLPSDTLRVIATIESGYDSMTGAFRNTRNWLGAQGLMQLKPIALADIRQRFGYSLDPFDPVQAIVAATLYFLLNQLYLRNSLRREPDARALVVAYNGGWTAGRHYMLTGQIPSRETVNYIAKLNAMGVQV